MGAPADPLLPRNEHQHVTASRAPVICSFLRKALLGVCRVAEKVIDWTPFIATQCLEGTYPPDVALGCGTAAAVFVMLFALLKRFLGIEQPGAVFPKMLDFGQFLLFGFLWILALCLGSANGYVNRMFVLWYNPFTSAGIALVMYASILHGRPFVFEIVQAQMPPAVWRRMSSRKWFLEMLSDIAFYWVKLMLFMTSIATVQPVWVTVFYAGQPDDRMEDIGNVLDAAQFVILFYGIRESAKEGRKRDMNKQLAKSCRERGELPPGELKKLHEREGFIGLPPHAGPVGALTKHRHRIRSLDMGPLLDAGGRVLAEAFRSEEMLNSFLGDKHEDKVSFYTSSCRAISYFNLVLGCFDEAGGAAGSDHATEVEVPRCVMACIPVLSPSHDEIDVFNSFEAWTEHGFQIAGATESDFPLPDDDLIHLGQLRKRRRNSLTRRPYIYIAYFGAESRYQGQGYGRTLLRFIVELSERKALPLVLETSTLLNISHYERYGFEVRDRLEARPEWVLMVREVTGVAQI